MHARIFGGFRCLFSHVRVPAISMIAAVAWATPAQGSHFRGADAWGSIDAQGVVTVTARTRWRKGVAGAPVGTFPFSGVDPTRFGNAVFICQAGPAVNVTPPAGLRLVNVTTGANVFIWQNGGFNESATVVSADQSNPSYDEAVQVFGIPLGTTPTTRQIVSPPLNLPHGVYDIIWTDYARVAGVQNIGDPTDPCESTSPFGGFGFQVRVVFNGTPNAGPVLASQVVQVVPRSFDYSQHLNARDPEGDAISYALVTNPAFPDFGPNFTAPGLTLSNTGELFIPAAATISWVRNFFGETGDYVAKVKLTDSRGAISTQDILLGAVTSANHPPHLNTLSNAAVRGGQTVSFTVTGTDPDAGQTLTLNATGLPAGASFAGGTTGPSSGVSAQFTWTPTLGQNGTFGINFYVTDSGTAAAGFLDTLTTSVHIEIAVDDTPPATTATRVSENACSLVDVVLTAQDEPGGSGVKEIRYSIDGGATVVVPGDSASISFNTAGVHSLTFFATDQAGNAEAPQTLSVKTDNTPPQITCPATLVAECTGNKSATVMPLTATATDDCTTPTVTGPAVGAYALGTTSVTYTATDGSGNSVSCTANIVVEDTTPPSIMCPANVAVECTGNASANVTPNAATATDACSATNVTGPRPGVYPLGTTTTTYVATDESDHSSSCDSSITVVDTTPPNIACPAPVTAECTGNASANVTPGTAMATDACTATTVTGLASASFNSAITVVDTTRPSITCPPPVTAECTGDRSAFVAPPNATASDACTSPTVAGPAAGTYLLGTTLTSYSATDASGNANSCSSSVSVVDTTLPDIVCPLPVVAECTGNASANVTPPAASASDLCSNVAISGPANRGYALGTTSVTYSAVDTSGNSRSCMSVITVQDTSAPTFDPSTLATRTLVGTCSTAALTFALPSATDACTAATVSCSSLPGNSFGANTVTCTATDTSGNSIAANWEVDVLQPLHVVFAPPLADDNIADDVNIDTDVNNVFRPGQTIPHKITLLDCAGHDVTTTAPVTVKLVVSRGANGGGTDLINELGDFAGVGDVGGLMALVDQYFQFNLKTNAVEYPGGGAQFQSLVTVSYRSAPALVVGTEDARLVSR